MQKISPFLWFDTEAEEAARFYVSLFPNSRITQIARRGENVPGPTGEVMTVAFELSGQSFMALNGGPQFRFTEAISMMVACEDQAEIDRLWGALGEGGQPNVCGWLKDRYGLSWQITPKILPKLFGGDQAATDRVMAAVMTMTKLEVEKLEAAYRG